MSLLSELNSLISGIGIPVETGVFSESAPAEYVVLTPLIDAYELHGDDRPEYEIQEIRLSLFSKDSYTRRKRQIEVALLGAGITITLRRYIGHEDETEYHHYAIDVAKNYTLEE
ncbi:hypothetical protein J0B03_05605 [Alkalibacter rhizosphaerae]|uniref:DUF3168 domain-containing protein n=1 Tax=Alkalibacter rhizosphaerae TaxID=2815577 RepID=A0A974XGS9_9FIRM|nr:hypothetical protein [Alkalibacter rhizosphaerae]QSX09538.1 hypothetical protein J0B03_05605 [Alkalibacter rhizosphaerae]